MKPQVLLLGHTGFIGKHIFEELKNKKISKIVPGGIKVTGLASQYIDLLNTKSVNLLSRILKKDTLLIITAAINRELGDNLKTMQDNIKMISHIAQALEEKPVKKCVYLSTADVYGRPEKLPITEKTPISPKTYYATAKYCCERILETTSQKTNFPLLVLRYNGVFGPEQRNIGYGVNFFIKEILENGVIRIWGDGKELRDTVYVKDLAKIITELSLGKTTGVYNIATGKSRSFMQMIEILKKISSKKFRITKRKRTTRTFDQSFDISKLKNTFPKLLFTPMENALKKTFDSFNQLKG